MGVRGGESNLDLGRGMHDDYFGVSIARLYSYNARKFVLVGVGPIGCIPFVRVDDKHEECSLEMSHLSAKY
ncbi:hypothetical protein GBA52_014156 [Prunus armeniaca]|nr:hypothetical protein GBA52_014156 [Prunus armeniaca]